MLLVSCAGCKCQTTCYCNYLMHQKHTTICHLQLVPRTYKFDVYTDHDKRVADEVNIF